jgi:uncharacterized SAM-binding protein YcdF (DUF218 family)
MIQQGVPEEANEILPAVGAVTDDEANLFVQATIERKLKSFLLVTSAYHSRRALWTFERTMLKSNLSLNIGIVSPPTGLQSPPPFRWWLSSRGWCNVGLEYVKIVYYWLIY